MKKLIFLAILAISAIGFAPKVHAQTQMTNPNGLALDTATQAAAEGAKLKVPGQMKVVSIVVQTTKISGTIAGTVAWQVSNDPTGANASFVTLSTTALADATTNYQYKEVDKGFLWYRALITQTGTSSLSYKDHLYASPAK